MNLQITADKVKEAADKCPQAAATLKTLFPKVFQEPLIQIKAKPADNDFPNEIIAIDSVKRNFLIEKCEDRFSLSPLYDWKLESGVELVYGDAPELFLIPTFKYY